jgi:hypothetical protein
VTPVRNHEAAEDELLDEIGYLELQAKGLSRRFFAEVRRTESLIAQFPQSVEEIRPGIRKRYPPYSSTPGERSSAFTRKSLPSHGIFCQGNQNDLRKFPMPSSSPLDNAVVVGWGIFRLSRLPGRSMLKK